MERIDKTEIKKVQILILNHVTDFCDNNNIKYFLCAGTLLGAVRHKGYIPWDDDIDLMMLREDYEKFIESFNHSELTLFHYSKQDNYNTPFIKISHDSSSIVDNTLLNNVNYGINIDIFPIDNICEDRNKQKKLYKHTYILERLLSSKRANHLYKKKSIYKRMIKLVLKMFLLPLPISYLLKKIDKLAQANSHINGSYKAAIVGASKRMEIYGNNVFENQTLLEFEGKMYSAPANYDEYLTIKYGNYMQLPPEDQRKIHDVKAYVNKNIFKQATND